MDPTQRRTGVNGIEGVSWDTFALQIMYSTCVQIGLMLIHVVFVPIHRSQMSERRKYHDNVTKWIGTSKLPALNKTTPAVLYVLQFVASVITLSTWIIRSYSHDTTHTAYDSLEFISCAYVFVFYFYNMIKYATDPMYTLSPGALVDVYTSIPVFMKVISSGVDRSWLDVGFLRSYRVLQAYTRLEATGILEDVSDLTRACILVALRTMTMVCIFAGTIFFCEVLGDIPSFTDNTVQTGMGDISFYIMCYWVFTTVSTVGYGDYSPTTVLSRFFIVIFIITGVIFFSTQSGALVELMNQQLAGKGSYKLQKDKRHVLVCGGGVRRRTEVLDNFLEEILHPEHFADDLNIVLMNPVHLGKDMEELLNEEYTSDRVLYLCGSVLNMKDCSRAALSKASMAFILADTATTHQGREDTENIIRAMAIQRQRPDMPFRLMLLCPESLRKAHRVGLPATSCYSINALKMNMLSQACRCPGFAALLTGMVSLGTLSYSYTSTITVESLKSDTESWVPQYVFGSQQQVKKVSIAQKFYGMPFWKVAQHAYNEYNIAMLAVQRGASFELFPANENLAHGDSVFVLCPDEKKLEEIKHQGKIEFIEGDSRALDPNEVGSYDENDSDSSETDKEEMDDEELAAVGMVHDGPLTMFPQFAGVQNEIKRQETQRDESGPDVERNRATRVMRKSSTSSDMRQRGEIIAQMGGHILLCGVSNRFWELAKVFMKPLRCKALHETEPVVMISSVRRPPNIFHDTEQIAAITHDPTNLDCLVKYGLETASRIVIIAGTESGEERAMVDAKILMIGNCVERHLRSKGLDPYADRFVIYELQDEHNLELLPRAPDSTRNIRAEFPGVRYSWRAVSGTMIASNNIASLYALAFYAPGIMEIFECMVSPLKSKRDDPIMPWRCPLPSNLTMNYGQLVDRLLGGAEASKFGPVQIEATRALAIGLHRGPGSHGAPLGYVFTNPPRATSLLNGDAVYVLAPAGFSDMFDADGRLCIAAFGHRGNQPTEVPTDVGVGFGSQIGKARSNLNNLSQQVVNKTANILHLPATLLPSPAADAAVLDDANELSPTSSLMRSKQMPKNDWKPLSDRSDDQVATVVERLFDRYDINGSGTIDSLKELQMLTVSTFFALRTSDYQPAQGFSPDDMEKVASSLANDVEEPFEWEKHQYVEWFEQKLSEMQP